MEVVFAVNGQRQRADVAPLRRLLDILREDLRLIGTKEGCGEGECGACAVLMDGRLVNACLVPALQLGGRSVVTIEGLGDRAHPDPIQSAFLSAGAVQCGFCIPGMVMATRALLNKTPRPTRAEIRAGLAGNLCRCTGYERIVRAVEDAAGIAAPGRAVAPAPGGAATRQSDPRDLPARKPATVDAAVQHLRDQGAAITIVAGATDLLTVLREGDTNGRMLMDITGIESLQRIERQEDILAIGAGVTFAVLAADPLVAERLPALAAAAAQIGAAAIRNRATLGGNLVTASPAADSPPVLIALGARIELASSDGVREVPAESFFPAYRKTARTPQELVTRIKIPLPADGSRQAFVKVGTRSAQSIAKVAFAGFVHCAGQGRIEQVRLAAGSVAPTALRLRATEGLLRDRTLDSETAREAGARAAAEACAIDDVRSTALYRRTILGRLVRRFLEDAAGTWRLRTRGW